MGSERNKYIFKQLDLNINDFVPYNDVDLLSSEQPKKIYSKKKLITTSRFRSIYSNVFTKQDQKPITFNSIQDHYLKSYPSSHQDFYLKTIGDNVYISNIFNTPEILCNPIPNQILISHLGNLSNSEISTKIQKIEFKKYTILKATTNKFHYRIFNFEFDQQRIIWKSKKKHVYRSIDLESVYELRFADSAYKTLKTRSNLSLSKKQFSIVLFYTQNKDFKTLTIFTSNLSDFNDWVFALKLYTLNRHPVHSAKDLQNWEIVVKKRQRWEQKIQTKMAKLNSLVNKHNIDKYDLNSGTKTTKLINSSKDAPASISIYDKFESNKIYSKFFFSAFSYQRKSYDDISFEKCSPLFSYISEACKKHSISLTSDEIKAREFKEFIIKVQKENLDDLYIQSLFDLYSSNPESMTNNEFLKYFKSAQNKIVYESGKSNKPIDMDRPLNEYFIASSHNTYLLGSQIIGVSSIEGYARALLKGCRCIEIDCWDGPLGEPVVCHGRTLTSRISFKDAIKKIKKYSFIKSPYPVILSLEIRCGVQQQSILSSILKSVLGDQLITKRIKSSLSIPSPNELKNKFLVKTKVVLPLSKSTQPHKCHNQSKISKDLSELAVYFKAVHFEDLNSDELLPGAIVSISETAAEQLLAKKRQTLTENCVNNFIRIYPSFSRINSTNFNPINFWNCGVQMVALNYQTYDKNMEINNAFFNQGNCSGYVLKPKNLRSILLDSGIKNLTSNNTNSNEYSSRACRNINIKLLSASMGRNTSSAFTNLEIRLALDLVYDYNTEKGVRIVSNCNKSTGFPGNFNSQTLSHPQRIFHKKSESLDGINGNKNMYENNNFEYKTKATLSNSSTAYSTNSTKKWRFKLFGSNKNSDSSIFAQDWTNSPNFVDKKYITSISKTDSNGDGFWLDENCIISTENECVVILKFTIYINNGNNSIGNEFASAYISIDSLKSGYRYLDLIPSQTFKSISNISLYPSILVYFELS
ncbi:1-phosphatidylinositol 4,5-bisphosphate phosphodiesterase 1 [Smittium culicis]|uniref:Phosphoinositide phospholipase C n=1 Tax=Smittium culicis TaxID=133412 RepID=A0A1R1YQR5_9FUNG|nr:1-phosphatidylinositol 4,5-bisphosphate phosphodiesterase 1 [Smittium culicis]